MAESHEETTPFDRLVQSMAQLTVSVGLMGAVIDAMPEHAQLNWHSRVDAMTLWADRQREEVMEFGSAFDGPDPDNR